MEMLFITIRQILLMFPVFIVIAIYNCLLKVPHSPGMEEEYKVNNKKWYVSSREAGNSSADHEPLTCK